MGSQTLQKKNGKSKVEFFKSSTYLSEKSKKTLEKLAKAEGKSKYEIINDAITFYASSKK